MRFTFALALAAAASGSIVKSFNGELIDGQYIVVFHNNVTQELRDTHMSQGLLKDAKVLHEYSATIKGYALQHADEAAVAKLSELPEVDFVEQDQIARALDVEEPLDCTETPAPQHWGLRRVSAPSIGTNPLRASSTGGDGTTVYIIDTGIYLEHNDYTGRVAHSFDCTGEGPGDGNGHGTHCASTAAGTTHGVAKRAPLRAVKVLSRSGSGTFACVIAGIDHVGGQSGRRIGSLSLGGGFSAAVNNAVDGAVRAGAAMSSASGNSNANACNFSPASAPLGVCVNSMQNNDARSGFSNFGTCSDIFAPGTNILGAWIGSPTATRTISGTSMACPHVTGVMAETWSANAGLSAAQLQTAVVSNGVTGRITNPGAGSPNVLSQTSCAR